MNGAAAHPALPPALHATLVAVAALMDEAATRPWWIIASAAVALAGAEAGDVRDVDVLLDPADAAALMDRPEIERRPDGGTDRFRSALFGRWTAPPLPVEFMAGFEVRTAAGWHAIRPTTRMGVRLGGAMLYVPEPPELLRQLGLFGRAKDRTRIAALMALG